MLSSLSSCWLWILALGRVNNKVFPVKVQLLCNFCTNMHPGWNNNQQNPLHNQYKLCCWFILETANSGHTWHRGNRTLNQSLHFQRLIIHMSSTEELIPVNRLNRRYSIYISIVQHGNTEESLCNIVYLRSNGCALHLLRLRTCVVFEVFSTRKDKTWSPLRTLSAPSPRAVAQHSLGNCVNSSSTFVFQIIWFIVIYFFIILKHVFVSSIN